MPESSNPTVAPGNAQGGRSSQKDDTPNNGGPATNYPVMAPITTSDADKPGKSFVMNGEEMKGSLKVYIKIDLEADIRLIAKVKGDIAIGLL